MTESDLRAAASAWLVDGVEAVVVEVARTRGSAPRDGGTRMLVAADGTLGTIGGGHLELEAIAGARAMLAGGERVRQERSFALGPSLGQCCGGAVTLAFSPIEAAAFERWPASAPLFRLQLHGAGHVGRAIATLLATLDVEVDWFDERDEEFPAATGLGSPWPSRIRRVCGDTIEREVRHAPPGAFYLVLTHEHALDLRIVEAVLRRDDFGFCGLIGSKTKRATFERRLAERGVDPAAIGRMVCPIGIEGIEGKAPEAIAVAVVAQLLVAHGRGAAPAVVRTIAAHDPTLPAAGDDAALSGLRSRP